MNTHNHSHDIDFKKDFTVEKLPGSQVKITGEIPFSELQKERDAAIKKLGANVKIDGFREGKVPETVLEKHIGEMHIIAEMAERALAHCYPHILEAHEIDAIGHPDVQITKIAADNPLGFTATVAVIPTFELPDYKKIAKEANADTPSDEVTEDEVDEQIKAILRQKRAYERLQEKAAKKAEADAKKSDDGVTDLPTPESEAAKQAEEEEEDEPEPDLNDLTDEKVKELGQPGQFETVADFRAKLREHLEIEKKRDNNTRQRAKITDAIIEKTVIDLPDTLVEAELNQMYAQMEEDLKRSNLKMDDYLNHIKKTKEELGNEWKPAAEKRAKLQLILNEIAKAEDIKPDKEELDKQTNALLEQYKDADKHRVMIYVASTMINEGVIKLLEEQI